MKGRESGVGDRGGRGGGKLANPPQLGMSGLGENDAPGWYNLRGSREQQMFSHT